ncbi:hypothetical protein [Kitasatospora sp. NPDC094011]|uniref:hypothetical protein n=1 Tax=Kitasatospora sp. NPDC094011 TaxID=3364090 RepID=UPI0037FC544E
MAPAHRCLAQGWGWIDDRLPLIAAGEGADAAVERARSHPLQALATAWRADLDPTTGHRTPTPPGTADRLLLRRMTESHGFVISEG